MRKRCAWCGTVMVDGEGPTSDGICEECEEKHFPQEVVAFNWDHPAITISHGIRRFGGNRPLTVPSWVLPKSSWWTPDRMGIAALAWALLFVFLLGVAVGS